MNYQDFDAASLMQQAPANFLSPETMASMPSLSSAGSSFDTALNNFLPMGQGFQGYSNPNLAGSWMNMLQPTFRYGQGGVMNQPNNAGSLPGATTTLPTEPKPSIEGATNPFGDDQLGRLLDFLNQQKEKEYVREDKQLEKIQEMAREANKMGQWNTIMGSVLKDIPKALSEGARRRNMYIGDMLKSQADAARERSVGIQQAIASMPGAPARNYIRI
jgi:hypothetical protein